MNAKEWLGENNQIGIDIFENKYRHGNETVEEFADRVSGGDKELAQLILDKKFLFGGRVLANRGIEGSGNYYNCFSDGYVPDSMNGILDTVKTLGTTYKAQGGQGISLSKVRPEGTPIGDHYKSDGIVPFMRLFNSVTETVSQGGSRKGALMMSLDIRHKEAEKFITIKSQSGEIEKANLSLEIDDEFMEAVETYYETGKVVTLHEKREYSGHEIEYDIVPIKLYKLMMETVYDWGEPGCIFTNRFRDYNLMEFDPEYNVETCNPSLRAGTEILTDTGIIPIEKLEGKSFKVYTLNGEWSAAECFLSGRNQPLYEIELTNGVKYYATKEHRWVQLNNGRYTKVFTEDLKEGDLLPISKNVSLPFGHKGKYEDGFFIGYWYGDGSCTIRKDDNRYQYGFTFGLEKKEVGILDKIVKKLETICNKTISYTTRNRGQEDWFEICCGDKLLYQYMNNFGVIDKWKLPAIFYSELSDEFRKGFVDGIFSADGSIVSGKNPRICFCNKSEEFVYEIKNLLGWYGIQSRIQKATSTLKEKQYTRYDLTINRGEVEHFKKVFHFSHTTKQKKLETFPIPQHKLKKYTHAQVKTVKLTDLKEDVWDIHVYDDTHTFALNHCITGNCGEQPLKAKTSCNLGSLNLYAFVKDPFTPIARFDTKEFKRAIEIAIRALDDIIDENMPRIPMQEYRENSRNYRNIGLGIMGYADMLIALGFTYGSDGALHTTSMLFDAMLHTAVQTSNQLAKEKGAFPKYTDQVLNSRIIRNYFSSQTIEQLAIDGLRNCSLLSIAPTGSIATMLGVSGGIEPEFALGYVRRTDNLGESYTVHAKVVNDYLNVWTDATTLPDYFITSGEINWRDRVKTQGVIQNYIDTAISSTVNLPKETTPEEIEQLYLEAWREGLKGITIFRDGCKRLGILLTDESENNTRSQDENNNTSSDKLERGTIIMANDDVVGKKRKLTTGCGSTHCTAFFDPVDGNLLEVYLSRGSQGTCVNYMTGLSRMISLAARGGIHIDDIIDQLNSCGVCPSYAVRTAKHHDTSKGACCPIAIGYAIKDMYDEMQEELGLTDSKYVENYVINTHKSTNNESITNEQAYIQCPECGEPLTFEGGCNICKACGYSKCD